LSDINIQRLKFGAEGFTEQLRSVIATQESNDQGVEKVVSDIIADVRKRGDKAVLDYTSQFDNYSVSTVTELIISPEELTQATARIKPEQLNALEVAAARIRSFHEKQRQESWQIKDEFGSTLGQKVTPVRRVGVYVPGGKAAYPSSVLMNIIPARVAGVSEIVMVVPAPDGAVEDLVLAAAKIAGATQVITVGGAQAVAALAYGTESISRVDKITGPGNIYVATAKKQVFGVVGIDLIAGPSEIMIISDGKTPPDWIAMDLFSQAEHDEQAQAILVSWDSAHLDDVALAMDKLIGNQQRREIIKASLHQRGLLIEVNDASEAIHLANLIAPEHLELSVAETDDMLSKIDNVGAIFLGRYTPEALGDYCAGPNHVLPTAGTARFSSPLGVYDFQKRSSVIGFTAEGVKALTETATVLANSEGLFAHAQSVELRSVRVEDSGE